MPKDYEGAAQLTSGVLSNSNSRPTIIIIDALNQVRIIMYYCKSKSFHNRH